MGLRSLYRGIAVLAVVAFLLLALVRLVDAARSNERLEQSTFIRLIDEASLQVADITQVDIYLAQQELRWRYSRVDGIWRLPEFAGAYALSGEVDQLLQILLTGQARTVEAESNQDKRYGLNPRAELELRLSSGAKLALELKVGALAPGASKNERYVMRGGDSRIYLFGANPVTFFENGEPPMMLDRHVLPLALPRGFPRRITWRGGQKRNFKEVIIKDLPIDPEQEKRDMLSKDKKVKERKPTHEFRAVLDSGATRLLDYEDGTGYINTILNLEFDKIVGSISPVQLEYQKFDNPLFEITLHINDESSISLAVSSSLIEGKYPILNRSSGQVFVISDEKFKALQKSIRESGK